jgi:hypothetical protein
MPATYLTKQSIAVPLLVLFTGTAFAADKAKVHDELHGDKMEMQGTAKASPADASLIASAMKAAPDSVAKNASVVVMDDKGAMKTLRKGSNGFTCMPYNPVTPGPDPMCMDANSMAWLDALLAHKTPPTGKVGFMYMLAGGTDASNTDPYATKPEGSNHWIKTGPHIMVVGGDAAFYDSYPKSADPDTAQPYVMWAGTPYQHLMAPVH